MSTKFKLKCVADSNNLEGEERIRSYMVKVQPGFYRCKLCIHFNFACTANLKAHIESRHYSPGYTCGKCSKVFKISNVARKHLKKCEQKLKKKKCRKTTLMETGQTMKKRIKKENRIKKDIKTENCD